MGWSFGGVIGVRTGQGIKMVFRHVARIFSNMIM